MSDPASEEPRPRPQYGEYATPEEQRARIQQPDATWLLETGQDPDAAHDAATPAAQATPTKTATGTGRFVDRVATITLLVYGFVQVVTGVPSMIDYEAYVSTVLDLLGVDAQLTDPAAGRAWGVAAASVLAIGWLFTAYASWRSLKKRRITWWIPLVAGVVFTAIAGTLLTVPLVSDPALWSAVLESTR